jgi:N-acetyl sugar amidotransferase
MTVHNLKWCVKCLAMSTRPRIKFDSNGVCNACSWSEKKKVIDWSARSKLLEGILLKHKSKSNGFDCLVPVSGGKDGSYVAHNLKNKYGINPLCVTVNPALPTELGDRNLRAFVNSGYHHIAISPDPNVMRILNRIGFVEKGFPYYGWLISIHTAILRVAYNHHISLIFYGEDGEVEYGGSVETIDNPIYNCEYQKRVYLEGGYQDVLNKSNIKKKDLFWFQFPNDDEKLKKIDITHWSYFENWDPYRNYLVAKEYCGLEEANTTNSGTFTNYAQNDQSLYALHTYLMYLKFGFGRANQDASIEIRRGAMDREQAINLVRIYDGLYPDEGISSYLDYYQMNINEFNAVIDKFANKELFEKLNDRWVPKFSIK